MDPGDRDAAYLWDMAEAAKAMVRFIAGHTFEEYLRDEVLRSAVERQIEIVGEAAKRISSGLKAAHPEIPWRGIIAQRNVLAHQYGEIDHEKIWLIATVHAPQLVVNLQPLLAR